MSVVAAGESERSLLDYVRGAAELVERGEQHPRWWFVSNLFDGVSSSRWVADVGVFRATQASRREAEKRAAVDEARRNVEAQEAAQAPRLTNLEIQRLAREVLGRMRGEDDDGEQTG